MFPSTDHRTMGRIYMKSTCKVLCYLLIHLLVHSYHSLIPLLSTARCTQLLTHLLIHLLSGSWYFCSIYFLYFTHLFGTCVRQTDRGTNQSPMRLTSFCSSISFLPLIPISICPLFFFSAKKNRGELFFLF